jgi:hypothetical protein
MLAPGNRHRTSRARATDLRRSPSHGGWAVAAAVARHHHRAGESLMPGWYDENGTSVSATERLRAALPIRRRLAALPRESASSVSDKLRAERLSLVTAYIGEYPSDEGERLLCNTALHHPVARAS